MFACCQSRRVINAKVFCNGIKLEKCFAADEELGIALCYEIGPSGGAFKDPDHPGESKKILYQGKIEVKDIETEYWPYKRLFKILRRLNLC